MLGVGQRIGCIGRGALADEDKGNDTRDEQGSDDADDDCLRETGVWLLGRLGIERSFGSVASVDGLPASGTGPGVIW
ncbi:MAG: hypothetical protein WAY93_03480 [Atopobiaceae bacterium]|jgi:hypothetical protein|nr:hypothetical protein [Atopobiaceae bacterium]